MAFAEHMSVSSMAPLLFGSSNLSSWTRLVFINSAMRDFVRPFAFTAAAIYPAITALTAETVTYSRMPFSSSQLSNEDPTFGFTFFMSSAPSFVAAQAPIRPQASPAPS